MWVELRSWLAANVRKVRNWFCVERAPLALSLAAEIWLPQAGKNEWQREILSFSSTF